MTCRSDMEAKKVPTTRVKKPSGRKSRSVSHLVQIGSELRRAQGNDAFTLMLSQQLKCEVLKELQFDAERKFRFDYAIPEARVAIEIDGGAYIEGGGRHNRAQGFIKDMEKMNLAAAQGWRVMHFTPQQQYSMLAVQAVRDALRWTSVEREK